MSPNTATPSQTPVTESLTSGRTRVCTSPATVVDPVNYGITPGEALPRRRPSTSLSPHHISFYMSASYGRDNGLTTGARLANSCQRQICSHRSIWMRTIKVKKCPGTGK
ncbi:hypothetical protein CEXT_307241 [Caerostris extrusa]|uniref:Uncharacterized protein n=1 Tax=Caerostris extrusa TaxID=172846 RepID=A0AAV4TV36_CAEEX|nr:hypothetical protein CEXT_307241 [Caerostris extrusa]